MANPRDVGELPAISYSGENIGRSFKQELTAATAAATVFLPAVGIYSDLGSLAVDVTTLSDVTYSANTNLTTTGTSRTNPLRAKTLTISGAATLITSNTLSLWFWVDHLVMSGGALLYVPGEAGGNCGDPAGAAGGLGGSGGGGGGGADSLGGDVVPGGAGNNTGVNGSDGTEGDTGGGGIGGLGYAATYTSGCPVTLPTGGYAIDNEGNNIRAGAAGKGASGDGRANETEFVGGVGGAGSGGHIGIVCNKFTQSGTARGFATGGDGATSSRFGHAAGGGTFYMAVKWKASAGTAPSLSGGFVDIYTAGSGSFTLVEINSAGTALGSTHATFTDTWNNS